MPTIDASHQPSSRAGIVLIAADDVAGNTYANSAAVLADAAFGPAMPANSTPNTTGMVINVARTGDGLTAVPMTSNKLLATARPRCASSLSRRRPPNDAITSVANPPNAVNVASCRSPTTSYVSANRPGTTTVARTARIAAGFDHTGSHVGRVRSRC